MLEVVNPANETVITRLETDQKLAVSQKFAAAKIAQLAWRATPYAERVKVVERFRKLLAESSEEGARILTSEVGKPLAQARNEVNGTLARIDFFLSETSARLRDQVVQHDAAAGMTERISQEPLGVIANISAWNYPYFVGSNVFIPALLTGNAVLYKPSEFATLTGRHIEKLWHDAGLPSGLFQCLVGGGEVGGWLLDQPVDGVFFTGSYATGKKIMEKVAGRMVRVQLELGGKDPVYIRPDVNVKVAAESTADGAFYNAGQSCCAVERIYVHQDVYDKFVEHFVAFTRTLKSGNPTEEGVYFGPLARKAQLSVLEEQVRDAVKKGAKLLLGGERQAGKGAYFPATVLTNVDHTMAVMREESFGPVIGIQKVRDDAEALQLMNDTEYGLTAGVYTRDAATATSLMNQLNAGSVYWNCCDRVSPRLPWSGRGHSGIGSTLSLLGIDAFLKPKAWHLRLPS
ncbi:MAG: aldehyde dehydrogenase family protein [Proteobacteria bacterium]|nr:aldehyde dehydrogenase family protein [Pseudomonadota bacterium]